jgi:hypothetical protein
MVSRLQFRRGVSIVELIVVLGILAVMLGFLLPAIQSSRHSARDNACQNNLRQHNLALHELLSVRERLPIWQNESGAAGGWSVEILPFLEPVYASKIVAGTPLDSIDLEFRTRPAVFSCPLGHAEPNERDHQRSHYVLTTSDHRRDWFIIDAPIDLTAPWLIGIETENPFLSVGPHRGGFFQVWRNGQLNFCPRGER